MTAALVALALALAGATGGAILLATWLRSALLESAEARKELVTVRAARDAAIAKVAALDSQLADATFRMVAAEAMRDELSTQVAQYEAGQIRKAPTADAARAALNEQLRQRAKAAPDPSAADGDRRPGDPVRAPTAPSAP